MTKSERAFVELLFVIEEFLAGGGVGIMLFLENPGKYNLSDESEWGTGFTVNDSKPPRFSIIINVFNGEKDLSKALDRIFRQTYSDWELIIWDDRSTDGKAAI